VPHRAGLSGTDDLAARSLSNVHPTEQVFDFCRLGYIYGRVKQDWYSVPSALSGVLIFIRREHRLDGWIYLSRTALYGPSFK
jgi:hypothetical protein